MDAALAGKARIFKTAWFAKAARKAHIADEELCDAAREAQAGQADDLGGGVFKKRLNKNRHRSILLAKGGQNWIYQYLFAKSDRDNVSDAELLDFRKLAKIFSQIAEDRLSKLTAERELLEICHDDETEVQKRCV